MTTTEVPTAHRVIPALVRVGDVITEVDGEPIGTPAMVIRAYGVLPDACGAQGIELETNASSGYRRIFYRHNLEQVSSFTVVRRQRGFGSPETAARAAAKLHGWVSNHGGHLLRPRGSVGPRSSSPATRREENRGVEPYVRTGLQGYSAAAAWMTPRRWLREIDGRWYVSALIEGR